MTTVSLSSNATVRTWQTATNNTTVASNIAGVSLKGTEAAAFLFGKALSSLDASFFGAAGQSRITRQQAAFEFPAGSGNKVSLTEVADALRYKFNTDPIVEYSADLGATGYSLADINELLRRLNLEYTGRFSFEPLTLRTAATSQALLTELDGQSADWLLGDLMTDAQRQAMLDLARQLKAVAQNWVDGLYGPGNTQSDADRRATLAAGLALGTSTTVAIPGQSLTLSTLIQRAGTAMGLSFSARFPDLFRSNVLVLDDVNTLLAAARELLPQSTANLADVTPPGVAAAPVSAALDELAEFRRAFKEQAGSVVRTADLNGLSAASLKQVADAARGVQAGLLDESLLQRLAFGERISWDAPLFFDPQGQPASIGALLGGRDSPLSQRLLAVMPQMVDVGLRLDDLRRLIYTGASADATVVPTQWDDPARAPLSVDGTTFQGGAAVLMRIAAALRSVPAGTYASVGLDAGARVFDDPLRPGSGTKWSLNDLNLLARRSAGYTALVANNTLYDTDLDTVARQLELVAGRVSTISLSSDAVPDAALSWWANQLVLATSPVSHLFSADQALFRSASGNKSFKDLLADVQRLFGCELAPRLEALGILQSGPLRNQVNAAALNQFLVWQRARDPLVTTAALSISPAPDPTKLTLTASNYRLAIASAQLAGRELLALKAAVEAWVPMTEATASSAPWRAAQQRLAALGLELGATAQTALGAAFADNLKALASGLTDAKDTPTVFTAVRSALNTALSSVQTKLETEAKTLGLSTSDVGPLMGTWTFAADAASVVADQQTKLAAVDASRKVLAQSWQNLTAGPTGNWVPDITASSLDTPPKTVVGVQAAAVLLARSLGGLSASAQLTQKDKLDPDAALFVDPAAWDTRLARTLAVSEGAPKISLRQMAARGQAALGFDFMSDYGPAAPAPWTLERLGGLIQLINGALRLNAATPYAGALAASTLGTAQGLRDKVVKAAVQELVVPPALRTPLANLLNAFSTWTEANFAARLDAAGTFSASDTTLFAGGASFNSLVAAGNSASPSLASVLTQMNVLVNGRVYARGVNALVDLMRVEAPGTVTVNALPLPAAVLAQESSAVSALQFSELVKQASAAQSNELATLNEYYNAWLAAATNSYSGITDQEWNSIWKPFLRPALETLNAAGLHLPTPDPNPLNTTIREALASLIALPSSPRPGSALWASLAYPLFEALSRVYLVNGAFSWSNPFTAWRDAYVSRLQSSPGAQFDWKSIAESLMVRSRTVDLPPGTSTVWYSVAHALAQLDSALLPADGSGALRPLFEYPPGSGTRLPFHIWRQAINNQVNDPAFDVFSGLTGDINFATFSAKDRDRLLAAIYRAMPEVAKTMTDRFPPLVPAGDAAVIDRLATAVGARLKALTQTVTVNPTPLRTEAELRQDISNGSDVYINRDGAFFINGVRTRAVDLAVVSRFLVQDSLSAQYKTLMDEMAQRNNLISAARSWVDNVGGVSTAVDASSPLLARAADAVKTTLTNMGAAAWGSGAGFSTALSADNKTALRNTLTTWATNTGSTDILYDISGGRWSMSDFNNASLTWTGGMTAGLLSVMDERIRAENLLAPLWSQNALVTSGDVMGDMTGGRFTTDVAKTNRVRGAERLYTYLTFVAYDAGTLNGTTKTGFATLMQQELTRSGVDILSEATGGTYTIGNWTGNGFGTTDRTSIMNSLAAYINRGVDKPIYQASNFAEVTGLLNTLISNKIRDGDLAQSKLQSITGQLQNNIEAISALIKSFNEVTKSMVQALR